jgi:hypothetical protein
VCSRRARSHRHTHRAQPIQRGGRLSLARQTFVNAGLRPPPSAAVGVDKVSPRQPCSPPSVRRRGMAQRPPPTGTRPLAHTEQRGGVFHSQTRSGACKDSSKMAIGRSEDRDNPWDPSVLRHHRHVWDPIRVPHLGQRPPVPHTKAEHMTAIDQNVIRAAGLAKRGPSTYGSRPAPRVMCGWSGG